MKLGRKTAQDMLKQSQNVFVGCLFPKPDSCIEFLLSRLRRGICEMVYG